jgi:hypothetical protein
MSMAQTRSAVDDTLLLGRGRVGNMIRKSLKKILHKNTAKIYWTYVVLYNGLILIYFIILY